MRFLRSISTGLFFCVLAAAAVLLAHGCAKKAAVAPPPSQEPSEELAQETPDHPTILPERIAEINIIDDRRKVDPADRILNMPEWTIVGQKDKVYPTIGQSHDKLIRDEIRGYFGDGPPDVTVDVYVIEGSQHFTAGERYESITAAFGLRLEIASHANVHDVRVAEGKASLDREALDITYDVLYLTYDEAIVQSIRDAIGRVTSQKSQSGTR